MDLTRESAERIFALFQSRDIDAVLAVFAEDAIVFDPHYPVPEMRGKAAIRRGFAWAFGNMEKSGFAIRTFWPAAGGTGEAGNASARASAAGSGATAEGSPTSGASATCASGCAAMEVDTQHVFKGGMKIGFQQVFVIEARDGLVTRLQSYVPYPPPGIGGFLARLTRLVWRLKGV